MQKTFCWVLISLIMPAQFLFGARACCEGNEWLKWSAEVRQAYVVALMRGINAGYSRACRRLAITDRGSIDDLKACLRMEPKLTSDSEVYVELITSVYRKY